VSLWGRIVRGGEKEEKKARRRYYPQCLIRAGKKERGGGERPAPETHIEEEKGKEGRNRRAWDLRETLVGTRKKKGGGRGEMSLFSIYERWERRSG